ncbi:MAG: YIP1 family protein [Desulfobacterales bacterium]
MENKANLNSVIEDVKKVLTNPAEFYQSMAKTGGFVDPVIFLVVMAFVSGIIVSILSIMGVGMMGGMPMGFGALIMMPIFALIGSFIGAAILFVIWKLMGSDESYETAYRCIAYASAIYPIMALLGIVPYIGSLVGVVWGMYLMINASVEVHKLNSKTAYIVFGVLGALLVVFNLSSEIATRKMHSDLEGMRKQFEGVGKQLEDVGEMTPEEAGKAVGDFLKGFEKATEEMNSQSEQGFQKEESFDESESAQPAQ